MTIRRGTALHEDDTGAYFTFGKNPVLLPPTPARLIERRIAEGRRHSAVGALPDSEHKELLLPGRLAGRPRSHGGPAAQLPKHRLPTLAARITALFGMAGELPPIIMCDLFGIRRNTATQWAALAQNSWAGHLAALHSEAAGKYE
ncbi:MAG: hypothetical protein JF597_28345 [Streptomyces sp.]|uniref:hypothetical protein n=1 Tax=Streptomyces sp. TaxID=1931 RepID=UPI0025F08B0A|nr:hypothetical protein [Streptomyces sp.]MBW8797364.1 hypothetical protein [Streptomyces sp.]